MIVISIPSGLRMATGLLLLAIPIAVLETIVATRTPWWNLPQQMMLITGTIAAVVAIPLAVWIANAKRWAFYVAILTAATWIVVSGIGAIFVKNPSLGFFSLFIAIFFSGIFGWIRAEMGRSFFDPRLKWYQGAPQPVPKLVCEIESHDCIFEYKVGRLDREGAFIFSQDPMDQPQAGRKFRLVFRFGDRSISCEAVPMCILDTKTGVGFQFLGISADKKKELGDFIEVLRGEGYVS